MIQKRLAWVDDLLRKDIRSRELKIETDMLRQRRNTIAREINAVRKSGKDAAVLMAEAADLPGRSSVMMRNRKRSHTRFVIT